MQSDRSEGRWSAALAGAEALATGPHADIAAQAAVVVDELKAARSVFDDAWATIQKYQQTDLAAAKQELLRQRENAARWQRQEPWQRLLNQVQKAQQRSQKQFAELRASPTIPQVQGFIADHPGAAELAEARALLRNLQRDAAGREQLLQRITQAETDKNWNLLHQLIRDCYRTYPNLANEKNYYHWR